MNTTTLLVDILIIGIQVLTWISFITLSYFLKGQEVVSKLSESTSISLLLVLSFAYTFGVMFDYIIPKTLKKFEDKIDKKFPVEKNENREVIDILNHNPEVHKYLDNHFSRLRIARATVFNIPLITISLILYSLSSNYSITASIIFPIIVLFILGLILTLTSYKSWENRKKVYAKYMTRAYRIIEENN